MPFYNLDKGVNEVAINRRAFLSRRPDVGEMVASERPSRNSSTIASDYAKTVTVHSIDESDKCITRCRIERTVTAIA
jgi:hypothetical protein